MGVGLFTESGDGLHLGLELGHGFLLGSGREGEMHEDGRLGTGILEFSGSEQGRGSSGTGDFLKAEAGKVVRCGGGQQIDLLEIQSLCLSEDMTHQLSRNAPPASGRNHGDRTQQTRRPMSFQSGQAQGRQQSLHPGEVGRGGLPDEHAHPSSPLSSA